MVRKAKNTMITNNKNKNIKINLILIFLFVLIGLELAINQPLTSHTSFSKEINSLSKISDTYIEIPPNNIYTYKNSIAVATRPIFFQGQQLLELQSDIKKNNLKSNFNLDSSSKISTCKTLLEETLTIEESIRLTNCPSEAQISHDRLLSAFSIYEKELHNAIENENPSSNLSSLWISFNNLKKEIRNITFAS